MNKEMVMMVESIAREKDLKVELVWKAVEDALAFVAKKIVKGEPKISVSIDRATGEPTVIRHWVIVDDVDLQENQDYQVLRPDAPDEYAHLDAYDEVLDVNLGRQAAQLAKQSIIQKLRDIEQHCALIEMTENESGLLYGVVKAFNKGNIVLDVGRLEVLLPKSQALPKDHLKIGARIKVAFDRVEKAGNRDIVFVSRSSESFMRLLLEQEVVQIEEGDIEIVKLVRAPGIRCKVMIKSHMPLESTRRGGGQQNRLDPVRIVLGNKFLHAQNIFEETGERLDVINYTDDLASLVTQCLSPAEVSRLYIDEQLHCIEATVSEDDLGKVIGAKGQNIRLISELLDWSVDVLTPEQASNREQERLKKSLVLFEQELDVDEDVALALVENGFSSLEDVAYCELEEICSIEGFDEGIAKELQTRAKEKADVSSNWIRDNYGKAYESLKTVPGIKDEEIEQLVLEKVISADDLADLATDELLEKLPHWRPARAQSLIMSARSLWEKG